MKISVEVDGYEFQEHFEEFYEKVRMARQMKNGRAVDRKEVRKEWNDRLRTQVAAIIEEEVHDLDYNIDGLVQWFDDQADQKLFKMVKEYQPA